VSRALFEESLALSRSLGDKQGMASMLNNLGIMAHQQGDTSAGRELYEESLAIRRELGDKWSIAASLNNLGLVAQEQGDYDEARALHKESLTLHRDLGERVGVAGSLSYLGAVAAGRASRDLEQATKVGGRERSEPREPPLHGQLERAATLFGAVDRLLESMTAVLSGDDRQLYVQNLAAV